MIDNKLQSARAYIEENAPLAENVLPMFHLTGGIGWINDPNGFAPYRGMYHCFYQYNPYDTYWGPMYWGHAVTRDFIKWEQLPVALAPDTEYDKDGCFSGGAVEMPDGRHLLMYTGVRKQCRADGTEEEFQTQCIAIGDGVHYEKYAGNPVITAEQLPAGNDIHDFRDPHIWRENDTYYAVIGNRSEDDSGTVLLYKSTDALHWDFVRRVASCRNQYGKMWECPDFFPLDGESVLMVSPQEMPAIGREFHAGNGNVCLIGKWDEQNKQLLPDRAQAVDYGLDFYAMQTTEALDGRRIMIAWMQDWEMVTRFPHTLPFFGQMTLPRELSLRDGRLCQLPVRELEQYRRDKVTYDNIPITGETELPGIHGRFLDLTVTLRPAEGENPYRSFRIELARDEQYFTALSFFPDEGIIRIDRSRSGMPDDVLNVREFPAAALAGELKLRIILDRCSIELFVNDGLQAASNVIYTPLSAEAIRFACDGAARVDVEKYDLKV